MQVSRMINARLPVTRYGMIEGPTMYVCAPVWLVTVGCRNASSVWERFSRCGVAWGRGG